MEFVIYEAEYQLLLETEIHWLPVQNGELRVITRKVFDQNYFLEKFPFSKIKLHLLVISYKE